MKRLVIVPLAACLLSAACGGGASSLDLRDPASYKAQVDHRYFPLVPGRRWILEGLDEGFLRHDEIRVLDAPREIWGIPCTGLLQERRVDDELVEVTTEWYAEDRQGNVWKFGEESLQVEGGTFERSEDSWLVGEGDALPWMMLSHDPLPGERYAGYSPEGLDFVEVQAVGIPADVPAGSFADCLEVVEVPEVDIEDRDIILYAAGVGRIRESHAAGALELVAFEPGGVH